MCGSSETETLDYVTRSIQFCVITSPGGVSFVLIVCDLLASRADVAGIKWGEVVKGLPARAQSVLVQVHRGWGGGVSFYLSLMQEAAEFHSRSELQGGEG